MLKKYETSRSRCPDCANTPIADWEYEQDPEYVLCECMNCGHEWLERWEPESIIPPYKSDESDPF